MVPDMVTVPRARIRALVVALVIMTVAGAAGLLLFGVSQVQQRHTNEQLAEQSARIAADAERSARAICEAVNEARADSRTLMQQGTVDAGTVLISVATSGPVSDRTRAAIDIYRTGLARAEAKIVADHAAKDHDCAAEARSRRRHARPQG